VLGVPASALRDGLIDLDVFWGGAVQRIRDQLSATPDATARISILQRSLLERLERSRGERELARTLSLCHAISDTTRPSIAAVAAAHGLSHRQVIAWFEHEVGLRPKQYQRVQRLRAVLTAIGASDKQRWAKLAVEHGYADQSHLIHEFRQLTGITPAQYATMRTQVGDGFVPQVRMAPA
jgi:AraC-like DNA-binding protein